MPKNRPKKQPSKPSYLSLLNSIAVGEARGFKIFNTWLNSCEDPVLGRVLKQVALREREHAAVFSKRLNELGFDVLARTDTSEKFEKRLRQARKNSSDLKKFRKLLKFHKTSKSNDPLAGIFDDTSLDIETATLLGRFIAEERDSNRALREQYLRLCRIDAERKLKQKPQADKQQKQSEAAVQTENLVREIEAEFAANAATENSQSVEMLCERLERLTETLEVIKSLKSSQA